MGTPIHSSAPLSPVSRMALRCLLLPIAFASTLPTEPLHAQPTDPFAQARSRMVDEFIAAEGITNERVLDAMRNTPRHEFVPPQLARSAYFDEALAIGQGQTISPPYIVAYMTAAIDPQPDDVVLEIGTGSGYQAAILAPLVKQVYSIEIVPELGRQAKKTLTRLKYENVETRIGDGYLGWQEHAPFDKIIVTCSPEKVPTPLVEQLAEGGKLMIPLGERYDQTFYLFEKKQGKLEATRLIPALFVPMTGESEDRRTVQPDPLNPSLTNGGFEQDSAGDGRPDGWHYVRQATLMDDASPNGGRSLRLINEEPGSLSQVLQGFAVDGRHISGLQFSATMLAEEIRPDNTNAPGGLVVFFFDNNRRNIGAERLTPPTTDGQWIEQNRVLRVPPLAREAILAVTLSGATGTLYVDNIRMSPLRRFRQ